MPVVSITRVRIRSWLYLPRFVFQSLRIGWQAKQADGNLAVKLMRDRRRAFWTATLWSSEASMRAFMVAGPHGPTMRDLLEWADEAAFVHWTQDSTELPTWEEAHRRLLKEGRPSKVNHPSEVHRTHMIPMPASGRARELHLKSR